MPSVSPACIWRFLKRHPKLLLTVTLRKWLVLLLFMVVGSLWSSSSSTATSVVVTSSTSSAPVKSSVLLAKSPEVSIPSAPLHAASLVTGSPPPPPPTVPAEPQVKISTDAGDIILRLLINDAPKTVANFMQLARIGFFNDTTLYRYEPNFVLQGGAWPKKGSPLPPVPLEYKVPNNQYYVSTARTSDPNSATSEYSIMLVDNGRWLGPGGSDPYGYAVFAQVVGGFDVIAKIGKERKYAKPPSGGLTLLSPPVKVFYWQLL